MCAVLLSVGSAQASPLSQFSSYYAFGDSLSDDGKFGELLPPSDAGRFSNGPVWTEILAAEFLSMGKVAANFAIGGATAGAANTSPLPPAALPFATFGAQVETFLTTGAALIAGDRPLVSVLFGANDLLQQVPTGSFNANAAAQSVADGIVAIRNAGPNFNDFVVANLPDVSRTPLFNGYGLAVAQQRLAVEQAKDTPDPSVVAALNAEIGYLSVAAPVVQQAASDFNTALAQALFDPTNGLQARFPDLDLTLIDQEGFFDNLLLEQAALGVDVASACTPSLTGDPSDIFLFGNCALPAGATVPDLALADDTLFVDGVHPNRIAQAEFAEAVRLALVPLPAGLSLMLIGVAAFGVTRARRRA